MPTNQNLHEEYKSFDPLLASIYSPRHTKLSISVVMPAYNEESNLEKAVEQTRDTFSSLNFDFEIFIINDKSTDKTGEKAEKLAVSNGNIQVFHHEKNQGSGGAFRTGINRATKEYVIFVPIDNPLDREDIEAYLPWMNICDIVVGCRVERVGYTRFSRIASFFYNRLLIPLLFNVGISDVNWIHIYKRKLFSDNIIEFQSSSFFFFVEILILAKRKQLLIVEVPARMKKRLYGKGTHSKIINIVKVIREMTT
tara:strand:- start:154 stop:912 length:759 start_codon:yes stop_codon:yes gene_type:complete